MVVYFPFLLLLFFVCIYFCVFHRELQVLFQILEVTKIVTYDKTHLLNKAGKKLTWVMG